MAYDPKIAVIVAKADDHGIGCSDGLPWHIPEELKYFKKMTLGKPVIMGRKTFQSLGDGIVGKPLEDRDNIVLTHGSFFQEGVFIEHDLISAIRLAKNLAYEQNQDQIMIIGGSQIFQQALKLADIVYLTRIRAKFPRTNAFLTEEHLEGWKEIEEKSYSKKLFEKTLKQEVNCDFQTLHRIAS